MGYSVRILADSVSPDGVRLTTMEWTYPRFIHSEIMTHRMLSRNAASSRAIPSKKLRNMIITEPVVPLTWVKEQPGMVGGPAFPPDSWEAKEAERLWLQARDFMVYTSEAIANLGIHKSIPNRLVEPFMWITVLITATDWNNLWHLRVAPDAEQHFHHIASMAKQVYDFSFADLRVVHPDDPIPWHLPLIRQDDLEEWATGERPCVCVPETKQAEQCELCNGTGVLPFTTDDLVKVSVGRCARVSYLTHDGRRDLGEDIRLHDQLMTNGHWSPFEHVATPMLLEKRYGYEAQGWRPPSEWSGNFRGWKQYRKQFPNEYVKG